MVEALRRTGERNEEEANMTMREGMPMEDAPKDRPVLVKLCAGLKSFEKLGDDWDGEGASAPSLILLDAALRFLRRLQPWHPTPSATLDWLGQPVIEFRDPDNSFFGKIKFTSSQQVELFSASPQQENYIEGAITSIDVLRFLRNHMQITLRTS
jgi:hypothetical protein